MNLKARDLEHVWHPCSQMKDHEWLPMLSIKSGKGLWLEAHDGQRYMDAVSSWWVNLFGHAEPRIARAIGEQAATLEQVILGGCTHEPVVQLSEQLAAITPGNLSKCFYADNGSSAVEVALKMSFHYWQNVGLPNKQRFVNISNSYHGETLGALSVGDVDLYKKTYAPLLLDVLTVPGPDCYLRDEGESWQAFSSRQADLMHAALADNHTEIAAVILEPLVQCAGNMRMYHPVYLQKVRAACDEYNVHLILDEIAVGFGRTGTLFACEQANITPDFMCLSKGLTGGFLPLSAVVTHDDIYAAFYADYSDLTAFMHSHSFTGNPIGCAAALATLNIFNTDNVLEKNQATIAYMKQAAEPFKAHPNVAEVRQTGMILAIELTPDGSRNTTYPWQERRGLRVYEHGLSRGALLRPLGNVVYWMPPYVITPEDIDLLATITAEGIDKAVR